MVVYGVHRYQFKLIKMLEDGCWCKYPMSIELNTLAPTRN